MKDEEKTKDHFLGVMATDVPLQYLQNLILYPLVGHEVPFRAVFK